MGTREHVEEYIEAKKLQSQVLSMQEKLQWFLDFIADNIALLFTSPTREARTELSELEKLTTQCAQWVRDVKNEQSKV